MFVNKFHPIISGAKEIIFIHTHKCFTKKSTLHCTLTPLLCIDFRDFNHFLGKRKTDFSFYRQRQKELILSFYTPFCFQIVDFHLGRVCHFYVFRLFCTLSTLVFQPYSPYILFTSRAYTHAYAYAY